jgi:hypothetical protein
MLYLNSLIESRRQMLLAEAENERLAALLPSAGGGLRHDAATACWRLAEWLDSERSTQPAASGLQPSGTGVAA